jgi:hypothetical protein
VCVGVCASTHKLVWAHFFLEESKYLITLSTSLPCLSSCIFLFNLFSSRLVVMEEVQEKKSPSPPCPPVAAMVNNHGTLDPEEDEIEVPTAAERWEQSMDYLRSITRSPRARLEELKKEEKKLRKKLGPAKKAKKPKQKKITQAFANVPKKKNFQGYDLDVCSKKHGVYIPPDYGWRIKTGIPSDVLEEDIRCCPKCHLAPCMMDEYCFDLAETIEEKKNDVLDDDLLVAEVRALLYEYLRAECGQAYVNKHMPTVEHLPSCALEGTEFLVQTRHCWEEVNHYCAKPEEVNLDSDEEDEFE